VPIEIKRAYKAPAVSDGTRILVDRLWPRGLKKSGARIDEWAKELAPSDSLRKWYGHRPERWKEFASRYRKELQIPERRADLQRLRSRGRKNKITLVFAAKDEKHCNARVLLKMLQRRP
jgi:uncharacterized protein YeaO (DUF488 family)